MLTFCYVRDTCHVAVVSNAYIRLKGSLSLKTAHSCLESQGPLKQRSDPMSAALLAVYYGKHFL